MKLNNIIIHKIEKQPNQKAKEPKYSKDILPINNPVVTEFAEALSKAYFNKKSKFYTNFKEENNLFKTHLDNYLSRNLEYVEFTKKLTNLLKEEMNKKAQSKGGFLVFMDYVSRVNFHYLFVALLDNKNDFSIEEDTLEIIKQMSLNIEHMAMASVINITKYSNKKNDYLTFLRGLREIPDYFIDFIGADKDRKRDIRELTKKWVNAIEDFFEKRNITTQEQENIVSDLINKIKFLNRDNEQIITSEMIANIIYPQNPDKFLEFIYDEEKDLALPNEFEKLDIASLKTLSIISYQNKSKNFAIKFKKKDFGNIITIEDGKLIIDDEEVVSEINRIINNDETR
jgi:nucleoid-associated protein